jgi:hypothetical protein
MRKIQRHTQEEMFGHVEAWKNSDQSQKIYCEQAGLAYTTFQYWVKKYREESSETEITDMPGFIPVEVRPDPEPDLTVVTNQLHFLFPNGIQVKCSERVHPEVLRMLLNP